MAGRIAQLSFFFLRRSFFACPLQKIDPERFGTATEERTNEVYRTNILAPGFWCRVCGTHLLPAFTARLVPNDWPLGSCIQLQQRNCSRFTRDFLRRPTFLKLAKN